MLNYIGTGLIAYLLANIFFEKVELSTTAPQTDLLPESARIPALNGLFGIEDLPDYMVCLVLLWLDLFTTG